MSDRLAYVEQLESQINTATLALEKLKSEKEKALVDVQHEEIENLEQYLAEAHVRLHSLSIAAEDAWHDLRDVIDRLMHDMGHSLKRLLGDDDDSAA